MGPLLLISHRGTGESPSPLLEVVATDATFVIIGADQLSGDVGVFLWFNHRHHFSNGYMGTGEHPERGHVEANDDQQ